MYCGKLAFGRRKNEKIPGTRNKYHIVKQDNYMLNDGIGDLAASREFYEIMFWIEAAQIVKIRFDKEN